MTETFEKRDMVKPLNISCAEAAILYGCMLVDDAARYPLGYDIRYIKERKAELRNALLQFIQSFPPEERLHQS